MKIAISFFSVLLLLTSGLLFFQYQVYSSNLEEGNGDFTYSQEIEIIYRDNSLDIRQHFKNLPNQKIQIEWPTTAKNPLCFIETENSCKRLTDDLTAFDKGETRSQSVSYIIPLDGGLQSKKLIQDVFAELNNGAVRFTTVHISTDSGVVGQWVTGIPLIGQQSLSLVNYAMFSGEGQIDDLYWQSGNFALQFEKPVVSIYSEQPVSTELREAIEKLRFLNEEHISVIQGQNSNSDDASRILFLPDLSIKTIEKEIVLSQVLSHYTFSDSPEWLSELIASYLINSDIGSEKTKIVKEQLTNYLTTGQAEEWVEQLKDLQGKKVSPKILDKKLSDILGAKTSYFELNTGNGNEIFPILLEDTRSVYVNELPQEEMKVILLEGQIFYSTEPLLSVLGYKANEGKNGYYVNSETRTFRFPKEVGFYVFNQRRYNTISQPIIKIADKYFIEEAWLQRLFLVELQKGDKRLDITSITY